MNGSGGASSLANQPLVVGIGASAGGVEALERLFVEMPDDTGLAFIVVQHLSDEYKSLMPQILSRKTTMPVRVIAQGMPIEANFVYVLPGGKSLTIQNNEFVLTDKNPVTRFNPIDIFFHSLADNYAEHCVGIVLSGTGSDGASGIQQVHAAGGFVIVQNESSAKFNGMPRAAIATGNADVISTVEEIPATLIKFSKFLRRAGKTGRSLFVEAQGAEKQLQHLLHQRFGIDFEQYKTAMFGRRLSRRLMLTKHDDIQDYLRFIKTDEEEQKRLYNDLLIGVTEFFRDPEAFSELQHRVLPSLLENALESGELRVWVTPCATGEEAYSLAILIDELIQQRSYKLNVKIFATDVNDHCIDHASVGIFEPDRLNNISKERLAAYFTKTENGWQIISRIRKQIVFATQNLIQDAPFTKLHLIACRNLLIYFKDEAKKRVLSLFNFSLKTNGVLFLGPSESTSELESAFKTVDEKWRFYQKLTPIKFSQVEMAIGNTKLQTAQGKIPESNDIRSRELAEVYDTLLEEYMAPGFLVDSQNTILHVFGDASNVIRFKPGRPSNNLMDLLPASVRMVIANGLKRVRIESKPVVFPGLELTVGERLEHFRVTIRPLTTKYGIKFLILFEQLELPQDPTPKATNISLDTSSRELIQSLEEELRETRESLHDSIMNLKAANEEMQSTNEELIASNEELQSTNEELHSVNEELYTVNSEYQRKITELTELTDDMDNLLDSLQVDTIFLDRNLRVRKFTIGIANTFNLLPCDIGREFSSFNHELKFDDIVGCMQAVLETRQVHDEEVQVKNGNWFLMRLLPYNSKGNIEGVLLTLIDITKMKQAEQQLEELSEIVQASDDAIFRVSEDGIVKTWNQGAVNLFMHEPENVIGKEINILGLDENSEEIVVDSLRQLREGGRLDHIALKASRRNGEDFDVLATISPIYNSRNEFEGASLILRDVTAQRKAEKQIREEVKRRDQFLAVLSHELRNPTAAILNASTLLKREDLDQAKLVHASEIVCQNSQHLSKMMEDLLDVARVTHNKVRLHLTSVDLVSTAHQVVECIEHRMLEKNQQLSLEFPNGPLYRIADETRIIQAQTNLLVNACKYTPENGRIRFAIWEDSDDVVIEVQDDGEGMSRELLHKIFDVFIQADQQLDRTVGGMGLGLPIVRMIADAHQGTVTAHSGGPGRGSKFTLRLPLRLPPTSERQTKIGEVQESFKPKGIKILIVEDNSGAREMLACFLELDGFVVRTAKNGVEGINHFEDFQPNACVVDIGLPDLNGFEVGRQMNLGKSKRPELLIALTGYGQAEDRRRVLEAGFDMHLIKPISPEELIEVIKKELSLKKGPHITTLNG